MRRGGLIQAVLILTATATTTATATAWAAEVNGYVSSRSQYTRVHPDGLISASELPQLSELLEVNAQVKQAYAARAFVYGDVSLFFQLAGDYRGVDGHGVEVSLDDRDVASARPFISLNELYLTHELRPELTLTFGKKRVLWGPGMAFNPTDLLNPPKDPTDPSLQRAGAWMAQVEVPLERYTFTFLASPLVTAQSNGLPSRMLVQPEWARVDDRLHYLLAARLYALIADSDVNAMLFFGNEDPDGFRSKLRGGLSFSRYFFDVNELHVEALLQTGSSRTYITHDCVDDRPSVIQCALQKKSFAGATQLEDDTFRPRVLVGARHNFDDESLLSLEYLYQGDGYTRAELQDFVNALGYLKSAQQLGFGAAGAPSGPVTGFSDSGIPTRFQFQPLGKHYAFLTYQKPKIRDDFTLTVTVLASLSDLSGLVAPQLSWNATEWLNLTASVFVPFSGPRSLALVDPIDGSHLSEYSLAPFTARALFEARVFY